MELNHSCVLSAESIVLRSDVVYVFVLAAKAPTSSLTKRALLTIYCESPIFAAAKISRFSVLDFRSTKCLRILNF